MKKMVGVLAILGFGVLWLNRNSPGTGEWLRRTSDTFTNALLLGTSDFEKAGRDPAKA
jgi:nitrate reductase gamma subunit